jgi:hypothetical protein
MKSFRKWIVNIGKAIFLALSIYLIVKYFFGFKQFGSNYLGIMIMSFYIYFEFFAEARKCLGQYFKNN